MGKRAKEKTGSVNRRIGGQVRRARIQKGLRLQDVGESLGVTYQQMQKYEVGVNAISAEKLIALAETLGVPVTYFFDEDGTGADMDGRRQVHMQRIIARLQEVRRRSPHVFEAISRMIAAMLNAEE